MSIGMVSKPPFAVLKSINDGSRDLEEMISKVKNFEYILDETMEKNVYKELKYNDKTPLFTAKTVEAMKKAKELNEINKTGVAYGKVMDDGEER